ncbi:HEAT repeat domain-containing protein [Mucisphaera sp.]|uniref:HEAT repeat domain-containing protein n=1 Tax=Mucisphaera sp. TaxID=2913024 RepID=UPI003D0D7CD6
MSPATALAQTASSLWDDFNHYLLIARPELAAGAGQALLREVGDDDGLLLEVVESSDFSDYEAALIRATRVEAVEPVATRLLARIQEAQISVSRDPARILENIERLSVNRRAFMNAVERLRGAGQFAAPLLLETLQDRQRANLHPFVQEAMVAIGRSMVYPLSEALPKLEPVQQGQIAQVLMRIGYPQALPYLKEAIEDPRTDPTALAYLMAAYNELVGTVNVRPDTSAALLYVAAGEAQYVAGTNRADIPGLGAETLDATLWEYTPETGLVAIQVPAEIFADSLAVRSSIKALKLAPDTDAAMTLFLRSNLRRENRLPAGEVDASYPADMLEASYYAMLSGPKRLHEVLDRALSDEDPALALDAIEALRKTAGANALVDGASGRQPLLRALTYPDRRVRFRAAETLAAARPVVSFPESERVVPTLGEAVRQSDSRYAAVVADDFETLNLLLGVLSDAGFEAFGGLSREDIDNEIALRPGVDLVVLAMSEGDVEAFFLDTKGDPRLGGSPVLAMVTAPEQITLTETFRAEPRFASALMVDSAAALRGAIDAVSEQYEGYSIRGAEAEAFAMTALELLEQIGSTDPVYYAGDAEVAMIQALGDERETVIMASGQALEHLPSPAAQAALADRALQASGAVQLALLSSLAESARFHGNLIDSRLVDGVRDLVVESTGELALAAARAHGALSLPTESGVNQVLRYVR